MAASDARPIPRRNVAYRVTFPILDADGDLVTGAASLDSEVSKDGGAFADCTNEATEIAASSGIYYLDLTASEMDADTTAIIVKTGTAGAKTTVIIFYPEEDGDVRADVTRFGGAAGTFSGGRPEVNVSHISGDATAADNLEAAADGTGYNLGGGQVVAASVTGAVGSVTGAVGSVTGNVGGNLAGSVGSLAAQAKADVNAEVDSALDTAIPGSPTANSINERVKAIDDKLPAGNLSDLTAAQVNTEADTALEDVGLTTTVTGRIDVAVSSRLASAGYTSPPSAATVAAAVWAEVLETGHSALQLMRLISSVLLGKLSGAGTATEVFRDVNDTKARVTATVTAAGDRTAVTKDAT